MSEANRPTRQQLTDMVFKRNLGTLLDTNQTFRKLIWTIMVDAGIFYPTFSRGSPHDTSYAEGRRAMGLEVLHLLKHARPSILAILEAEGNLIAQDIKAATTPSSQTPEDDDEDLSQSADDPGRTDLVP